MEELTVVAFLFDSGKLGSSLYGKIVFNHIMKGKELSRNPTKIIISLGDIVDKKHSQDISPYTIKDDLLTIDFNGLCKTNPFEDWVYCWVAEDISESIALDVDRRLKNELSGYIGMTRIDVKSADPRKQFWKMMIRCFSIERNIITSFSDPSNDTFSYKETAEELGYTVRYDNHDFSIVDEMPSRKSSFITTEEQLAVKKTKNDSDRGLLEMNYALRKEVQIAGAFIWKAIEDLDKMTMTFVFPPNYDDTYQVEHFFASLYFAAQGIERLQKVIIELINYKVKPRCSKNKNIIEKLLMSHNHFALNEWISKNTKIKVTPKCNKLIDVLKEFYEDIRYIRYKTTEDKTIELKIFKGLGNEKSTDEEIKHTFGKMLGSLCRSYYSLIEELCNELNIYVYELDSESTASFVFNSYYPEDLYEQLKRIQRAKKELLYWLIKDKEKFKKEYKEIGTPSLDFDPAQINYYLKELVMNTASNDLFDSVYNAYEEMCSKNKVEWKSRVAFIDCCVANPNFHVEEPNEDKIQ